VCAARHIPPVPPGGVPMWRVLPLRVVVGIEQQSRWKFDKDSIDASEREWQNYRLTVFNEKIQQFLSKIRQETLFDEISAEKNITKD
jgi:hypothetical protein